MTSATYSFDRFVLDPAERRLTHDGAPVELNARYHDALLLLVGEAGRLVTKDRFMTEVWRGVPVTDEALTQCIRTLRRQLGDDAAAPRFIETVPKHGYRFVAPVAVASEGTAAALSASPAASAAPGASVAGRRLLLVTGAGMTGGGVAGVIGGLFYGFAAMGGPGTGAASVLMVVLCLTTAVALVGAAGVALGIAAAELVPGRSGRWTIVGGAMGGMTMGAIVKLIGLDAFDLLFGQAPSEMTGAAEGALLGAAIGIGAWLGSRARTAPPLRRTALAAALLGGIAGAVLPFLGGRLMGGSLALVAQAFPASRLRLDAVGRLFGEPGFGLVSRIVTGAAEGALFAACIVAAMIAAQRSLDGRSG